MDIEYVFKGLPEYSEIFNKKFSELDISSLTGIVKSILYGSQSNNTENVNSFLEREIKKNFLNAFLLQYLVCKEKENNLVETVKEAVKEKINDFYPQVLLKGKRRGKNYSLDGRISLGPKKKDFEYLINHPSCVYDVLENGNYKFSDKMIVIHKPSFDEKQDIISVEKCYVDPSSINYIYKIEDNHMLCFKSETSLDGKTNFVKLQKDYYTLNNK